MENPIKLVSNLIGKVYGQILYGFQNCLMQFRFGDGGRAVTEFCPVFKSVDASPDNLLSTVDVPCDPLVVTTAVTADQSFG